MPSEVPVDSWEGADGLQFVGQAYPTHALLDSIPVSMRPNQTGDILRLKTFVYNVCTVRTGVVIHKQTFSTHGAPKQTYILFLNDITIDVVRHRYTLNMQDGSSVRLAGSQRSPITISREERYVTPMALMCLAATSGALSRELRSFAGQVSARTVRRHLLLLDSHLRDHGCGYS
ncbi:uncharacterized protein TNCV_2830641 [Trichonephila clavipes]|nr:uncharacterized protein TNCV_2830641 [Trichonephila clavipes]